MITWTPTCPAVRVLLLATLTLAACVTPDAPAPSEMQADPPAPEVGDTEEPATELPAESPTESPSASPTGANLGQAAEAETASTDGAVVVEPIAEEAPPREDPFAHDRLLLFRLDVGQRLFSSSDWDPVSDPFMVALGVTYEPDYWPVGIEAGFSYSTDDGILDGSGYRSTNFEISGGISKSFWIVPDSWLWSFSGGLSFNSTKDRINVFMPPITNTQVNAKDKWIAGYIGTRMAWKFSRAFDIGASVRAASGQNVSTFGPVRSSDNVQVLFGLGLHQ